ncbi:MAG: ATP-binding protein [Chitinispirillia bacterium]|nr:ATP-binding protein [Chitinispirillia bacterium]
MIPRPRYLQKMISLRDKHVIKVVTGIRRSGKSTLFKLFQEYLLGDGVFPKQIISLNMEDPAYRKLLTWEKLYDHIDAQLQSDKKNYVFIDEIQNVKDFQRAADGLFIKDNVDLYLTGSNSRIQSGKLATMLTGRYVKIHILPLSFKEYVSAVGEDNMPQKFQKFLELGGFPQSLEFTEIDDIKSYIESIYDTIVVRDISESNNFRDISRLERVIKFMADNIGKETSANNIANTMLEDGIKINTRTVERYLKALCDSFILYRADRYDVRGKKLLKTLSKYYIADTGLRYTLLGDRQIDTGRMLENIVYLELARRNRKVYAGKMDVLHKVEDETGKVKNRYVQKEIDFVVEGGSGTEYYQVAQTVLDPVTLERELSPLSAVSDHRPKYLLTLDALPVNDYNGIKQIYVLDWLLE